MDFTKNRRSGSTRPPEKQLSAQLRAGGDSVVQHQQVQDLSLIHIFSPTGQVYQGIQYAENMGFYRYEFLAGAILGLVLGLLSLGFLLRSAGLRQEGSEEVSLRWMDRAIPTDLLIAAGAAVLLLGFVPVACSSGWGASLVALVPTVLTMVLMGVVLAMALSLVRRRRRCV